MCRTSTAAVVAPYAAAADPADRRCSRHPGRRPVPNVNRACSSVHRRVEATVVRAFASAQGSSAARSGTAAQARRPTPPPHTTNRTKEEKGPGFDGSGDSITVSFRAGA